VGQCRSIPWPPESSFRKLGLRERTLRVGSVAILSKNWEAPTENWFSSRELNAGYLCVLSVLCGPGRERSNPF